jgi:hypothetical protein
MYTEISLNLGLIFLILIFIIQRTFHMRRLGPSDLGAGQRKGKSEK